jgi:methylthioribose-1-phosphate isomerase
METLYWKNHKLYLLDQTKLPLEQLYLECTHWQEVRDAISILAVRGAPAIGVAAAYGMVLAAIELVHQDTHMTRENFIAKMTVISAELDAARPTAVNLHWALNRLMKTINNSNASTVSSIVDTVEMLACTMQKEDVAINSAISEFGAKLLAQKAKPLRILTHCNAGALATAGIGTALGVIRSLHRLGLIEMVYADETRPLLQGARLTATELQTDGIPVTLITDSMAAWVMKTKEIDAVIVGADRIAVNGDTANKIGTYGISLLARSHGIPFYVAAPVSTFDLSLASGEGIPIEERPAEEIRKIKDVALALPEINVFNPAFDVTPHENITAIFTELGVIVKPDKNIITNFYKEKEVL